MICHIRYTTVLGCRPAIVPPAPRSGLDRRAEVDHHGCYQSHQRSTTARPNDTVAHRCHLPGRPWHHATARRWPPGTLDEQENAMNPPANSIAWPVRMADTLLARQPIAGPRWAYEWGLVLAAILDVGRATGDPRYFAYVKANVDRFVMPDGQIRTYHPRRLQPGSHQSRQSAVSAACRQRRSALCDRAAPPAGAAPRPPAQQRGRLLAQAHLPGPDVAGRHLHGRAVPGRIRGHVRRARPLTTMSSTRSGWWRSTPAIRAAGCWPMPGTRAGCRPGPIPKQGARPTSGGGPWAGS